MNLKPDIFALQALQHGSPVSKHQVVTLAKHVCVVNAPWSRQMWTLGPCEVAENDLVEHLKYTLEQRCY